VTCFELARIYFAIMAEGEPESSEIDQRLENVDLEYMLEFETQIFLDILHKDGLTVAAKQVTPYMTTPSFMFNFQGPQLRFGPLKSDKSIQ
jgi:hypothetical protein